MWHKQISGACLCCIHIGWMLSLLVLQSQASNITWGNSLIFSGIYPVWAYTTQRQWDLAHSILNFTGAAGLEVFTLMGSRVVQLTFKAINVEQVLSFSYNFLLPLLSELLMTNSTCVHTIKNKGGILATRNLTSSSLDDSYNSTRAAINVQYLLSLPEEQFFGFLSSSGTPGALSINPLTLTKLHKMINWPMLQ